MPDDVFYPLLMIVGVLITGFVLGILVGRTWEAEVRLYGGVRKFDE